MDRLQLYSWTWTVADGSHQHFYAPRYTAAIIVNCHHQQTSYSNIRVVKDASVSGHLTSDNIHWTLDRIIAISPCWLFRLLPAQPRTVRCSDVLMLCRCRWYRGDLARGGTLCGGHWGHAGVCSSVAPNYLLTPGPSEQSVQHWLDAACGWCPDIRRWGSGSRHHAPGCCWWRPGPSLPPPPPGAGARVLGWAGEKPHAALGPGQCSSRHRAAMVWSWYRQWQ